VKFRHGFALLAATAGVSLIMGAAPAFAAGPPVPAGCTFDQSDGVLTCVTSTTATMTAGPFSTPSYPALVSISVSVGGFTGLQICDALSSPAIAWGRYAFSGTFTETVTTTTTTEQHGHGLHSKVFATSTTTSATLDNAPDSAFECSVV
jgi:hypothetical protein